MTFTTVNRYLTRKNESTYKQIFKKCFPDSWRSAIPFPKDVIIAAQDENEQILGFCLVHDETPYPMDHGPGAFMYNLCVDPAYQDQGVGSAILQHVAVNYPRVYAHMLVSTQQTIMAHNGWKRVGVWREKYIEYAIGFNIKKEVDVPCLNLTNYDPDENLIYLS